VIFALEKAGVMPNWADAVSVIANSNNERLVTFFILVILGGLMNIKYKLNVNKYNYYS
jgi:hypothetical protein